MRNLYCNVEALRKQVFAAVAKLAYEGGDYCSRMEKLPYEIIPGEVGTYRESIFLERAIVGEHAPISDNIEAADKDETYYTPPLINIIKYACHACPDTHYEVTQACQGCLAKHCYQSCPKGAIELEHGRARIDQTKCIKCGRCKEACSYQAIIKFLRPCQEACGMNAIGKDQYGRADIDYDKCVNCGQCLVNCPFGAIVDKGQIFQLIHAIKKGEKVIAIIAPAFWGQFGEKVTPGQILTAMKQLGFEGLEEVAVGADLCAVEEAEEFMEHVPARQPFMATSCCPAWSVMAKKLFPEYADCVSMALTPMTLTARLIKKQHEKAKVVFIGPCAAKKLEAMRRSVRSEVDFVLTFEEMAGIFDARHVDIENMEEDPDGVNDASADGRNFAVAGGVAKSVVNVIKERYPDKEIKVANAEGLKECRKLLTMAKAGKYNGYLLEGMACPGGCVAGAGTMQPIKKSQAAVGLYASKAGHKTSDGTEYVKELEKLVE